MPVDSANNSIALTLKNEAGTNIAKNLTLDDGTYTPSSLMSALQAKIDEAFGTGMGGATVALSNNKLVLTSRLPQGYDGSKTYISCSTANSSFLKELNTTRTVATWTSNNKLVSAITIDSTNQDFTFTYKEGGSTHNIALKLSPGSYAADSIVSEINVQLAKTGTGITATSSVAGKLVLTSQAVGSVDGCKCGCTGVCFR